MSKKDGGPAFPCTNEGYAGITMRDYFAAKALEGDWASQNEIAGCFSTGSSKELFMERAKLYWLSADAMLAERDK